jgi:TonB family protein
MIGLAAFTPVATPTFEPQSSTFAPVELEERSRTLQIAAKPKQPPFKPRPEAHTPVPKPLVVKPPPRPEPQRPHLAPPRVDTPAQPQLPQANYPKAKGKAANQNQYPDFFASNDPFANAANQNWPDDQQANPDEDAAYPTYHPPVVIDGWVDEQALYVRFDLQASGAFRASIVQGTGRAAFDAIALKVVRQWKWQPKRIRGRAVASTEVIRLRRNEDRPTHHF